MQDESSANSGSKVSVMLARFPYGDVEHPDCTDYLMRTYHAIKSDPRIDRVKLWRKGDTPLTMTRNESVAVAQQEQIDFLLMVDSDMSPDMHLAGTFWGCQGYASPAAKPFWDTSFEFAIARRAAGKPCVIAAPYCGPPPHENVYVFHWTNLANDLPSDAADMRLDQFSRYEAARLSGIQEVAALPTGLILIDMQVVAKLDQSKSLFYYEYTDAREIRKASTEDVTFTRDLSLHGVEQFCNWDAWAGHWKKKLVTKPTMLTSQNIGARMRDAIRRDFNLNAPNEQLVMVNGNGIRHDTPQTRTYQPGDYLDAERLAAGRGVGEA